MINSGKINVTTIMESSSRDNVTSVESMATEHHISVETTIKEMTTKTTTRT